MKCFFCENVPVGICRWCGRAYCSNHGSAGCAPCRRRIDALSSKVYDKDDGPFFLGAFAVGPFAWLALAQDLSSGRIRLPAAPSWLDSSGEVSLAIFVCIMLLVALNTKARKDWRNRPGCLVSGVGTILFVVTGVIFGITFAPVYVFTVAGRLLELWWFTVRGGSDG